MNQDQLRQLIYKLSFSLAVTALLLLSVEIGCFLALRIERRHPVTESPRALLPLRREYNHSSVYDGQAWAPQYWREMRELQLTYEPYVVWGDYPYQGETITIDREGLRRTFHSKCDSQAYTIWAFGGSAMWGGGSPDWATIPSFLAERYEEAGRSVCVRNYGRRAWVNTQETIKLYLELKRAERKPDLVIFYDGTNDAFSLYQSRKIDVHEEFDQIKRKLERREPPDYIGFRYLAETNTFQLLARLGGLVASAWGQGRGGTVINVPDAEARRQFDVAYLDNFAMVDDLARRYGFSYAFFWQPMLWVEHKPLTPEEQDIGRRWSDTLGGFEPLSRRMYEFARTARRSHLFYIADVFNHSPQTLYIDIVHVSPEGNRLIATRIYEALSGRGL